MGKAYFRLIFLKLIVPCLKKSFTTELCAENYGKQSDFRLVVIGKKLNTLCIENSIPNNSCDSLSSYSCRNNWLHILVAC